jgi:aryl-alcohol dehydrogenase-like predicted oxidoreductase
MIHTPLGQTELVVSRLALGCEPLGGTDWGQVDVVEATGAVQCALELGINLFDTAGVYGLGLSEERLSAALGSRRHDVVIVTKFGLSWEAAEPGKRARIWRDCSPRAAVEAVESSLRRLRLDRLPVMLVHWPDPSTPIERTLDTLREIQARGRIGHFGLSNFDGASIRAATGIAVVENEYSLLERRAERDALAAAEATGAAFLAYGVLAQGLLTGKYGVDARFDASDRRHRLARFSREALQSIVPRLARLREIARRHGVSPGSIACRWVLDRRSVTAAIVGAKSAAQITDLALGLDFELTDEERAWLESEVA